MPPRLFILLFLLLPAIVIGDNECPQGCKCVPDPVQTSATLLLCHVPSRTVPMSTDYVHSTNVRSVFLSCEDDDVVDLPPSFFSPFPSLQHIRIEGCRTTRLAPKLFEATTSLRTLEMHSMSSPKKPFELTEEVLMPLTRLEKLSLTDSPSVVLPDRLLCSLPHLQVLNVSANGLRDVARDEACVAHQLLIVDLSRNQLHDVRRFIGGTPEIRQLSLAHNRISKLELVAPFIQQLDVEGNLIRTVESSLPDTLVHVNLASNELAEVPSQIYELPRLVALNISDNRLTADNASAFESSELESLDASRNELSNFPQRWLQNSWSTLVHLRLSHNSIEKIEGGTLGNASSLHTLDLSSNRIRILADDSITGANKLVSLWLANNSLEIVEPMALVDLQLDTLDLSHNLLTEIPAAVGRISKLRRLDLSHNRISKLYQFVLNKLNGLHWADLSDNQLQSIGPFIFADSSELYSLDLSRNNISLIFKDAFNKCPKLRKLSLRENQIRSLDEGLVQATALRRLDVSHNQLVLLQWSALPVNLETLFAEHNEINLLGAATSSRLKSVLLNDNKVSMLSAEQLPDSLESLELSRNRISHVTSGTLSAKSSLRRVDLSSNQLTILPIGAVQVDGAVHAVHLSLAGNPLSCSCEMTWIASDASDDKQVRVLVADRDNATCRHAIDGRSVPLSRISHDDLLCQYQQVCEPECVCCQYGNCDCKSVCPNSCKCFRDVAFRINVVRCDGSNSTGSDSRREFVVSELPVSATDIVLSGVVLPQLRTHSFIGRLRLQKLHINATGLRAIQPKAFHTLPALKTLDLSDNLLFSLSGDEFMKTSEVVQLFLNGNRFSSLGRGLFDKLTNLQFLTLHNNSFEEIPPVLSHTRSLKSVSLAGNPLRCDCSPPPDVTLHTDDSRRRFFREHNAADWMQRHRHMVVDASQVECFENVTRAFMSNDTTVLSAYPPNIGHDIFVMPMDAFLRDYNVSICVPFSSGFFGQDPQNSIIFVSLAIAVSFLLCLLVLFAVPCARKSHDAINQRRYKTSSLNCSTSAGSSPLPLPLINYHAFVSYSKRDEKMVFEQLCRPLEEDDYQLCLLHRDGPTYNSGVHAICDELIAQMDASQCLILVLTKHFLENEWRTLQIKTSHQLFAKNRSKRLIAVLGEGVDANLLDDELGQILRKHTRLDMNSHLFWTLLRSALPPRTMALASDDSSQVYSDVYGIVPSHIV